MNEHTDNLPLDIAQALPLLHALPAPKSLLDFLADWQAQKDVSIVDSRLRQKLLRWDKQRHDWVSQLPSSPEQWENFRRMLLSLLASPLVVLCALAVHLMQLKNFRQASIEEQKLLAQLTLSLYAPITNRLGLSAWKWEMEDIAFRLSQPERYAEIAKSLASKRIEREAFIAEMQQLLTQHLSQEQIAVQISGRPKHIYSIYKKMRQKNLTFEQLYDLYALRIMTDSVEDCYRILGILHHHFLPILGEFDDYIARPKANGYQSIHTILLGSKGRPVEVQIRTYAMHEHAEQGVAAHWRYKEGSDQDQALSALVNQLRASLSNELDALSFEAWEKELEGRYIFTLTPQGDVIRLIQGATALDFAYHIHTDLGHACRGALVNGVIKPLDEPLANGDRVEILSQKNGKPNLNWLSGRFLVTQRGRNKVRNFFNRQHADQHLMIGKHQLDKLRSRFQLGHEWLTFLVDRFKLDHDKTLAIRIGQGKITSAQLSSAVQVFLHPRIDPPPSFTKEETIPSEILISGVGKATAHFAQCCQPRPPSPIIGLLTRHHGLRIHRQDCPDLLALPSDTHQRLIRVRWGQDDHPETHLNLSITAIERENLLSDLVNCLTKEGIRIGHFHTQESDHARQTCIYLELSLPIGSDWLVLMDKIERLDQVIHITYHE